MLPQPRSGTEQPAGEDSPEQESAPHDGPAGRRSPLDPSGPAPDRAARPMGAGARGRDRAADPDRGEHRGSRSSTLWSGSSSGLESRAGSRSCSSTSASSRFSAASACCCRTRSTAQISHFQKNVPHLVDQANKDLANVQSWLNRHGINIHIQQQGQTALQTLQKNLIKRSGDIVAFSRDLLQNVVTVSFDLVLVLVLSVYLLVYGKPIGDLARRIMPPGDGTPADDFPLLVQRAVFGYMRGQILFSLIMGTSAAVALWIFGAVGIFPAGQEYAVFFGAFYGLMEFIPYIGPIIGPLPAVRRGAVQRSRSARWGRGRRRLPCSSSKVTSSPSQVFRISLRINPILISSSRCWSAISCMGSSGRWSRCRASALLRRNLAPHLVLESWGMPTPVAGVIPIGPDRCPDCGLDAGADDAYCRSAAPRCNRSWALPGSLHGSAVDRRHRPGEHHARRPRADQALRSARRAERDQLRGGRRRAVRP